MMSFSKAAFKAAQTGKPHSTILQRISPITGGPVRAFGAMNEINRDLFEHKFTSEMDFKSSFDKVKCFRILDEDGNVITPGYENKISDELLLKMYDKMVTMNEVDNVYNAAQRQARISFYMTQLGEEASGIGTAAALNDKDLLFP